MFTPSNNHRVQLSFYLILVAISVGLVFFIFQPFIQYIFLAIIFAIIFDPLHRKLVATVKNRAVAAVLSTLVVLVVFFAPLMIFGMIIFQEASSIYQSTIATGGLTDIIVGMMQSLQETLNGWIPGYSLDVSAGADLSRYGRDIFGWITNNLTSLFSGSVRVVFGFFITLLALFYFFKDSSDFLKSITRHSPLKDEYDQLLLNKVKLAVNSVVVGYLVIAVIQGILTGVGLALFGVPLPALWGGVAAVAALVPSLGTGLVLLPAVIFLFVTGPAWPAIGLVVWGALIVGMVDNLLAPYLVKRGIHLHSFFILISVLGGLALFGPVGFIAGPVILSLFAALLEMRREIMDPAENTSAVE